MTKIMNFTPSFKNKKRFILIAGPCVIENEEICFEVASELKSICLDFDINYIFKASFSKANRTRSSSFRGIAYDSALTILSSIRQKLDIPVLTDIHESYQASSLVDHVDIIQIPAFLSRQTYLLEAVAETGLPINIKKGEFMTTETLKFQVEKIRLINPEAIIFLTERGTTFGKNDVVIDFREVADLKKGIENCYSIVDCSHTVQRVNLPQGISDGNIDFTPILAKASIAIGVNGVFIETHPDPKLALSDSTSTYPLAKMRSLIESLVRIWDAVN